MRAATAVLLAIVLPACASVGRKGAARTVLIEVYASSGGPAPLGSRRTLEIDRSATFEDAGRGVHHGLAVAGDVLAVRAALDAADFKRALAASAAQDYGARYFDVAEITITAAGMNAVTIPVELIPAELIPVLASLDRALRGALGMRYDWPVGLEASHDRSR